MRGPTTAIDSVETRGEIVPVEEKGVLWTPFCQLLRFRREGGEDDPKILLVAPMSGHFATLLRGTIRTLLRDHQVYVTDWINPRNVQLERRQFRARGLHPASDRLHRLHRRRLPCGGGLPADGVGARRLRGAGPGQFERPAGEPHPDGRADRLRASRRPGSTNLRQEKPIEWFRTNMIGVVPDKFEGAGRRVYPGFLQLCAFMSMNAERHTKSFVDLFHHRVAGDMEKADAIRDFYKEYFAIMDMSADFYLETVEQVFQLCLLRRG